MSSSALEALAIEQHALRGVMHAVERALRRRGIVTAEVDDLVQETCLAVLVNGAFWQLPQEHRERYATRVALGLAANQARASGRRARREALALASRDIWQECFEHEVEQVELRARIYVAVLRLPDDLYSIALARFFRSQSIEDIARQQRLPIGTVKSRLRRARRELERGLSREPTRAELSLALRSLTAPEFLEFGHPVAKAQARHLDLTEGASEENRAPRKKKNPGATSR